MTTNKSLIIDTAEVHEVKEAFEGWRSGKKQGREPIPPKLWGMAARLCKTYSINRIARCLGLNYTALKVEVNQRLHRPHPKAAFVELTPASVPAGVIPGSSSAEYIVEAPMARQGMPRIHVRGASVEEVAALVRALRSPDGWRPGDNGEAA